MDDDLICTNCNTTLDLADEFARIWDECLDAIEQNELNTQQAREGNPYRVKAAD
jgi:hypothetical protein